MNDLATTNPGPLATVPASITNVLAAAVERGADGAALKEILAVFQQTRAMEAAQQFSDAMTAFRSACPPIPRRGVNLQFTVADRNGVKKPRTFARLEDIEATIREPLQQHGLSFRWGDASLEDGIMRLPCIVRHVGGHSESSTAMVPVDSKAGCSDQQKFGAAMTYAQRYSLVLALGLTSTDDDVDGNDPKGGAPTITEDQAANLQVLIDEVKADKARLLKWAGVASLDQVPAAKYREAVRMLEAKRGAR